MPRVRKGRRARRASGDPEPGRLSRICSTETGPVSAARSRSHLRLGSGKAVSKPDFRPWRGPSRTPGRPFLCNKCVFEAFPVESPGMRNPLRPRSEGVSPVGLTGFEPATTWRRVGWSGPCLMVPKVSGRDHFSDVYTCWILLTISRCFRSFLCDFCVPCGLPSPSTSSQKPMTTSSANVKSAVGKVRIAVKNSPTRRQGRH